MTGMQSEPHTHHHMQLGAHTTMGPTDDQRCTAKSKRTGDRCGAFKEPDMEVCRWHGGASPRAKAAARRRRETRDLQEAVVLFGLPRDVEPAEALLEEVRRSAGVVAWLDQQVRDLDPESLWWGTAQHEEGMSAEGPVDKRTHKAETPVVVRMWQDERKHLAQVAAAALKAGIEERRVQLAEAEAGRLAGVIRRVLAGLGLSAEQMSLGRELVVSELRALETGEADQ